MKIVAPQGISGGFGADEPHLRSWLHGRAANTALAYDRDARRFLAFAGCAIADVTLDHLQSWAATLDRDAHATRARRLAAVKSLLSFAARIGLIASNPGLALRIDKALEAPTERVLSPADVTRMLAGETDARLRALLRLLYVCGLRASEACALRWRDLSGSERKGGEARILGKGGKLRKVLVPADLWRELAALTETKHPESRLIASRSGGDLDRAAVHRAVKRAAKRAGVTDAASAHWLRHSHATHALENGCKIHVLRESLGHASLATTTKYLHARAGDGSSSFVKG